MLHFADNIRTAKPATQSFKGNRSTDPNTRIANGYAFTHHKPPSLSAKARFGDRLCFFVSQWHLLRDAVSAITKHIFHNRRPTHLPSPFAAQRTFCRRIGYFLFCLHIPTTDGNRPY